MTARSFIKRLGAMLKYRQAIKDMNRYNDATEEDLARENTCIICREDMHVWVPNDRARVERTRPKKLPCGHILHLGCLKSWMERQQVCPTCRRSVVIDDASNANRNRDAAMFRIGLNIGGADPAPGANVVNAPRHPLHPAAPLANGQVPDPAVEAPAPGPAGGANFQPPPPPGNGPGLRIFNFGPFRLGFAQGGARDIQEMAQRLGLPGPVPEANGAPAGTPNGVPHGVPHGEPQVAAPRVQHLGAGAGAGAGVGADFGHQTPPSPFTSNTSTSTASLHLDLQAIERRIEQGILELQVVSAEARTLRAMLLELQHIRTSHNMANLAQATAPTPTPTQPPITETPVSGTEQITAAIPTERAASGPSEASIARESATPAPQAADGVAPSALAAASDTSQVPLQNLPPRLAWHVQGFGAPHALNQHNTVGQFGNSQLFSLPIGGQAQPCRPVASTGPSLAAPISPVVNARAIPSGSAELPPNVQIPEGWSLIPLQPSSSASANLNGNAYAHVSDGVRTWQIVLPGQAGPSNSGVASALGGSASPGADTQARPLQQSPLATAEDGEGAAPALSSSEPPAWGGSAQLFERQGNTPAASSEEEAGRGS